MHDPVPGLAGVMRAGVIRAGVMRAGVIKAGVMRAGVMRVVCLCVCPAVMAVAAGSCLHCGRSVSPNLPRADGLRGENHRQQARGGEELLLCESQLYSAPI